MEKEKKKKKSVAKDQKKGRESSDLLPVKSTFMMKGDLKCVDTFSEVLFTPQ